MNSRCPFRWQKQLPNVEVISHYVRVLFLKIRTDKRHSTQNRDKGFLCMFQLFCMNLILSLWRSIFHFFGQVKNPQMATVKCGRLLVKFGESSIGSSHLAGEWFTFNFMWVGIIGVFVNVNRILRAKTLIL